MTPERPGSTDGSGPSEVKLRRWLSTLRRPDHLAEPEIVALLEAHGRLPEPPSPMAVGRAAAELLTAAIERLRPPDGASREEQLPYLVLKLCFVDGHKLFQVANRFGLSERHMTRERTAAIRLLAAELEARPGSSAGGGSRDTSAPRYRPQPIPTILGFVERPGPARELRMALESSHLVSVHGAPGVGKTALIAELAGRVAEERPVFWYRFRQGVNDSPDAFLFELGLHLREHGSDELSRHMIASDPDHTLATRLAISGLAEQPQLLVLDDFHALETGNAIAGFLEEAAERLLDLRAITVSRHRGAELQAGTTYEVRPLSRTEAQALLAHLGVTVQPQLAESLHRWTGGIPQLVKLAASWLKTAEPEEVAQGIDSLGDLESVQAFLLDNITGLIGPDDQAILRAASVFRDRFTDDALAFVSHRTRGEVQDASRRFVRAYVASRSRRGDVAFFHASVREYIYSRLGSEERAYLHERAARWYERKGEATESRHHTRVASEAGAEAAALEGMPAPR